MRRAWYTRPVRLAWLFNNFADPALKLTPEQRAAVQQATDQANRSRLIKFTLLVVLPPPLLAFAALGYTDEWIADRVGLSVSTVNIIVIALIVLAVWPYSAWAYARFYTRPYRQTINETIDGVHVCVHCGYDLSAIDSASRCPECGHEASTSHA